LAGPAAIGTDLPDSEGGLTYTAEGRASYYSSRLHGRRTASGEPYDESDMTAAHPSLPFGSRLCVTNLFNGRSTTVRVNDRGPFVGARIIDVSLAAARELGMLRAGTARGRVKRWGTNAAVLDSKGGLQETKELVAHDGNDTETTLEHHHCAAGVHTGVLLHPAAGHRYRQST